jgi:predicted glycoside hydrolase/deacetylase ChbG (UPF0249 family)
MTFLQSSMNKKIDHTTVAGGVVDLWCLSATKAQRAPAVIINADDWGRDEENTDRALKCLTKGTVSSVSAMVFMEDSVRAAQLAQEYSIDVGLHLNFTTPFTARVCNTRLSDHQQRLTCFLRSHRLAQVFYNPFIASSFQYVVQSQIDEYEHLFGVSPKRFDGHHHMHLCANVWRQRLLPLGSIVRRNFSFFPGEKCAINRQYRGWQNRMMSRRYQMADHFFAMVPYDSLNRLPEIFELARQFDVEIETHPIYPKEYELLMSDEFVHFAGSVKVSRGYVLQSSTPNVGAGRSHEPA